MDKDYPVGSSLEKSPKELGFSRADLWSFAGLVAQDYFLKQTDEKCTDNLQGMTCGDWSASECYQPFPESAKKLFKTGRVDCAPKHSDEKFQYVAQHFEAAPGMAYNANIDADLKDVLLNIYSNSPICK